MLARPLESRLSQEAPFQGALISQPYPEPLDADMHNCFEIGVMMSGQEDRHFENYVVRLKAGDVWLNPPWEPSGRKTGAPETRELVLQFLFEFLGDETLDGTNWLVLFAASPRDRPGVVTEQQRERVLSLSEDISRELAERKRGWLTEVRLSILLLLSALNRGWGPSGSLERSSAVRGAELGRILPALSLVHTRPESRVSLAEAAAACSLSVPHFAFSFRRTMGVSFGKFALRARLAYAAQLLVSTDLSVEAAAQRLGFTDGSHLALAFTKHYDVSPGRYRKEHQLLPELFAKVSEPSH